nr:MAG TPA: hypothetical protein [Caudoviricetes sp.]
MEGITDKLSYRELWESWKPDRVESEHIYLLTAFTPMGIGIIRRVGDHELWSVEPSWANRHYTVSSEDVAIHTLVKSYLETERRVVEAYVKRLKVNLGLPDEHGYVHTHTSAFSIRKGVELVRNQDPTGEVQTRDVYALFCGGQKIDKSHVYPTVWGDKITAAYQCELLKALNLR